MIGGERPNAVDFQVAPSVRLMLTFDQLRPHIDDAPRRTSCTRARSRLSRSHPGSLPCIVAPVLRQDVTLQGELAAWLWHPEGATGAVVMGHGLAAVRDQRLPAYAERFAQAGLAALLFDYRHFGASGGEPRQLLDIQRQLEDWRTALAYARGLDGIERVGLFGSSFGGGHALTIATESPAVAAVVAQCPMTDGLKASLMTPKRTALKLAKVALQDQVGSYFGRRPKLIKAAGEPGEVALMSAPDVLPGFQTITAPDSAWINLVAARAGLTIGLYRPGARRADRLPAADLRLRPRLAGRRRSGRQGRARRAAGRGRSLPDRPLRHLHRRVVGACGARARRSSWRATSAHLHRPDQRRPVGGHGELDACRGRGP